MRPGAQPIQSLALALTRLQTNGRTLDAVDGLVRRLQADPAALVHIVQAGLPPGGRLTLVVDRLEEIFTLCEVEAERAALIQALLALADHPHRPAWVVVAMRADFYDRVARYPNLVTRIVQHQCYIRPMSVDHVAEVIELPAAEVGAIFERGLAQQLRADAETQGELVLPLLEHTLDLLWRRRRGRWLTWDGYGEVHGVSGALQYHADRVIEALPAQEQRLARRMLVRLVWVDETTGTLAGRRLAKTTLIDPGSPEATEAERVLQRLADERLVVLRGESLSATAEFVHDALPLHWARLRHWMQDDSQFLLWRQRLRASLDNWLHAQRDPAALLRGNAVVIAERWLEDRQADLNADERAFIRKSFARQRGDQVRTISALATGLILALVLAGFALFQRQDALDQRDIVQRVAVALSTTEAQARAGEADAVAQKNTAVAEAAARSTAEVLADQRARVATSRQLAASALSLPDAQLPLALLLSLQAGQVADTFEARSSLLHLLEASPPVHEVAQVRPGPTRSITSLAVNQDGTLLVSGSDDGSIVLRDPRTGQPRGESLACHHKPVTGVALSPSGLLASTSRDGSVVVSDLQAKTPACGTSLTVYPRAEYPTSVAFRSDGQLLALAGTTGDATLWDVTARHPLPAQPPVSYKPPPLVGGQIVEGPEDYPFSVTSVAFDPKRSVLVYGSEDGKVHWWDTTGKEANPPLAHSGSATSVAFSPNGWLLASGSSDRTVRLWDGWTGKPIGSPLNGHTDTVTSVAWSPDGKWLASGSADGTVRLWDPTTSQPAGSPLSGHSTTVTSVAFVPRTNLLVSADATGVLIVWEVAPRAPIAGILASTAEHVTSVAFSPEGRLVASGTDAGTISLWNGGDQPSDVHALPTSANALMSPVTGLAFSSQGSILAAGTGRLLGVGPSWDTRIEIGTGNRLVVLWNLATGQLLSTPLRGHTDVVTSIAWSPDGRWLASGSDDRTVRLWDPISGQPVGSPLSGHTGAVTTVAWSPDGRTLASGSDDRTVRLWDPTTGQAVGTPLSGHTDTVTSVAWSPDGRWLASGSADRTVRLWDPISGQPVGSPLTDHTDRVTSVAWSPPGGALLASGSADGGIVLWEVDSQRRLAEPLLANQGPITSLAFGPDGAKLASGADKAVVLWDVGSEAWRERACRVVSRNLSQLEWEQYLGSGVPYQRTCPALAPGT